MRSETRLRSNSFCAAIVFLFSSYALAGTWKTIDTPGSQNTRLYDISNGNIVGRASNEFTGYSFVYDGTTYTPVAKPGAHSTSVKGISGNTIVGSYFANESDMVSHGFSNIGTSWMTLDMPGQYNDNTQVVGVSGNKMVGTYLGLDGDSSFFTTGQTGPHSLCLT
jgi:hypothetical protein